MYLDEDNDYPTLNGTGTEDYIGSAWGQGKFINKYTGCTVADDSLLQWAFYRFHVPDPVYFKKGCRVSLQQIGGNMTAVENYQKNNAPLIPVAIDTGSMMLYYKEREYHNAGQYQGSQGMDKFLPFRRFICGLLFLSGFTGRSAATPAKCNYENL